MSDRDCRGGTSWQPESACIVPRPGLPRTPLALAASWPSSESSDIPTAVTHCILQSAAGERSLALIHEQLELRHWQRAEQLFKNLKEQARSAFWQAEPEVLVLFRATYEKAPHAACRHFPPTGRSSGKAQGSVRVGTPSPEASSWRLQPAFKFACKSA